jgi:hypothetical protein
VKRAGLKTGLYKTKRRYAPPGDYFNFAYSDFAAMSTGISGSAPFQVAKKS